MEAPTRKERERQARREAIVEAAGNLFVEKGFEAASMDEVAKRAEFTKRTLYQYFPSKEDLYAAVVLRGFRSMAESMERAGKDAPDGFSRLRSYFRAYYGFYRDQSGTFALISRWGYVKSKLAEDSEAKRDLDRFNARMFSGLADTLRGGVADGSVRADVPVEATVYSLVFLLTGFLTQLSISGESFTSHFGLDREAFCLSTMDMVMATLSPQTGTAPSQKKDKKR